VLKYTAYLRKSSNFAHISQLTNIMQGRENTYSKTILRTKDLTPWESKLLQKAAKNGDMIKIRNGVYATMESMANTVIDISAIIPNGVLCMWSAWSIYGLTTQIPDAFYVAIERSRKIKTPEFPRIQLVYQSEKLLPLGRTEQEADDYNIPIYDIERCVCDAVKYRNKIGIDVMAEIVQNYLKRDGRNFSKLMQYAKELRVANILNRYLELWQ